MRKANLRKRSTSIVVDSQGLRPLRSVRVKPVYNNAVRPLRHYTYEQSQMENIRDKGIKVQNPTADSSVLQTLEEQRKLNKNLELLQKQQMKGTLDIRQTIDRMSGDQLRQLTQFMERIRGLDAVDRNRALNMAVAKLSGQEYRPPDAPIFPLAIQEYDKYDSTPLTAQTIRQQLEKLKPTETREADVREASELEKRTYYHDKMLMELDRQNMMDMEGEYRIREDRPYTGPVKRPATTSFKRPDEEYTGGLSASAISGQPSEAELDQMLIAEGYDPYDSKYDPTDEYDRENAVLLGFDPDNVDKKKFYEAMMLSSYKGYTVDALADPDKIYPERMNPAQILETLEKLGHVVEYPLGITEELFLRAHPSGRIKYFQSSKPVPKGEEHLDDVAFSTAERLVKAGSHTYDQMYNYIIKLRDVKEYNDWISAAADSKYK